MTRTCACLLISAALAAAVALPAAAAAPSGRAAPGTTVQSPAGLDSFAPPPFPLGQLHAVLGAVQSSGYAGLNTTAQGFTRIDQPLKIKCASANGCTIMVSSNVGVNTLNGGGEWTICPLVDGHGFTGSCVYLGPLDVTEFGQSGHIEGFYPVAQGTHTVATYVYTDTASYAGAYTTTYTLTTP